MSGRSLGMNNTSWYQYISTSPVPFQGSLPAIGIHGAVLGRVGQYSMATSALIAQLIVFDDPQRAETVHCIDVFWYPGRSCAGTVSGSKSGKLPSNVDEN